MHYLSCRKDQQQGHAHHSRHFQSASLWATFAAQIRPNCSQLSILTRRVDALVFCRKTVEAATPIWSLERNLELLDRGPSEVAFGHTPILFQINATAPFDDL